MEQTALLTSGEDNTQLELMKRSLPIDIYRQCIDANIYRRVKSDLASFSIVIDWKDLKPIITPYIKELSADFDVLERKKFEEKMSSQFDFALEARKSTQKVITLLYQNDVLTLPMHRETAKYAGPSNTQFVPENKYGYYFKNTLKYWEWIFSADINIFETANVPLPPVLSERNTYFRIELGSGWIPEAFRHIERAKKIGIILTDRDALLLESIRGIGHEYGHAINRALYQKGVKTFEIAKEHGLIRSIDLLGFVADEISDEHFAGGVSDLTMKLYLRHTLKWDDGMVNQYFDLYTKDRYYKAEAAYAFLEYATKKGFSPSEIIALQNAIETVIPTKLKEKIHLWGTTSIFAYHTKPYSDEQIKFFLSQLKA